MAQRIRILPEILTNKIAAGEVVERPASVVKELLENAIDAGATELTVEIEAGGKRLIRVTDNGCGMTREDALLALERHATSKIISEQDLEGIATLGFRGEALPSIASVSRFVLETREPGSIEGTEIYVEGGKVREVKACGMAQGTSLSVRNLFFNTPARLKFLKSVETESGHVGDQVTRLALSRPDIRFTYLSDGKTVIRAVQGELRERVTALLGREIAGHLHAVELDDGYLRVTGLVAAPDCTRSAASHIYTFINGRYVRDRVVQHAVLSAYRTLLERGRYPVVVLFLDIQPGEVDVNVHPTKHEVRFRQQTRVHDTIQGALDSMLRATPWLKAAPVSAGRASLTPSGDSVSEKRVAEVRELLQDYRPVQRPLPAAFTPVQRECIVTQPAAAQPGAAQDGDGYFSSLSVIGQYNALYILCQDGADLALIDQHAAHERVAFERLRREFAAGGVESQGLLFPETLEFSFSEAATLKGSTTEFSRLGFELENFGGTTWLLKGVPRMLAGMDYRRALRDMIEELQQIGRSRTFDDILEELLSRLACHSVVRGSHPLSFPEISALFRQMDATGFAANCPHGRPVIKKLTLVEIERMFKRG